MSVVSLSTGPPTVTAETLNKIFSEHDIKISAAEGFDYLWLLNSLDATLGQIKELPDYIDPRLAPQENTLPREWKKAEEGNALNAWSHVTSITSPTPTDTRLTGKTIALKDNISLAGVPLTGGTFPELFHGKPETYVPSIDAIVVQRLLASGATLAGTATCENFSMSALSFTSATGPVQNPWLPGFTCGGSSSGPAALVAVKAVNAWRARHGLASKAAELGEGVDMSIGGDQGGSIRIPAAYCGVYGLKGTHGLVPYTGIFSLHPMIDHAGPIAGSLEDLAVLLGVMAGYDGIDPRMSAEAPLRDAVKDYAGLLEGWVTTKKDAGEWTPTTSGKGLRVGVITESLSVMGLSAAIKTAFLEAVTRFKAIGATVTDISIPLHSVGPSIWTIATRPGLAHYGFMNNPSPLLNHPLPSVEPPPFSQHAYDTLTKHNPAVVNVILAASLMGQDPAAQRHITAKSMQHVHQLRVAYDTALAECDVLLCPVNPRVGSRHPEYSASVAEKMAPSIGGTLNTCPFNITGHPGLSVPIGFAEVEGGGGKMPVAMQVVGKRWGEEVMLRVAKAWEVPGLGLDGWDGR